MVFNKTATLAFFVTAALSGTSNALSLKESFDLAQQSDPQIMAAEAGYHAAMENIPQVRSALLPQLSLDIFAGNTDSEVTNISGSYTDTSGKTDSEGYQLTLNQTIYNHQFYKQLDQAKASVAQAAAFYAAQRQELLIRVAEAYFNVLAANDNLQFAIAEKTAIARQLEQTQKRFEVGLIAITDVKEAQAQYDITVAAEIAAQNQLETNKELLQAIINTPATGLAIIPQQIPLEVPEPNDISRWAETAMQQNLALKAASYALEAAQSGVNASRAGHYPHLSLQATQTSTTLDGDGFGADVDDTKIMLNLNIPLYSGGLTSSQNRQANQQLLQAQSNFELQKRLATQQTRSAFLGLNAAIAQVKALKQALISSQTAVEATKAGFDVGTRTSVDVLNALRNLYRSEKDYAQTRYNYLLNMLKLKQAAGTLNASDIELINQWMLQK